MNDISTLQAMQTYFDEYAGEILRWRSESYQTLLRNNYRFYIPPGARILEIGSGTGDLLASLHPAHGVGVDISPRMVELARQRHPQPELTFVAQAAEALTLDEPPFDYIVISDTFSFVEDIHGVLRQLIPLCHARTRIITNFYSRLWQPIIKLLELMRLRKPQPVTNWVTREDLRNLLELAGYQVILTDSRILLPCRVPLFNGLFNRFLAPLPVIRHFCLSNWIVAGVPEALPAETSVSVICACRNEAGNIPEIVRRFPRFNGPAELIFVEGHSRDDTLAICQQEAMAHPEREIRVLQQTGKGKGDAVRLGFSVAKYDILMILDADMTVPPEDLPSFVSVLLSGRVEFVNGSRLVYPMDPAAMRFLNLLGNKFFALAFSWLLGQTIKDTLCGTKVLLKSDYNRIAAEREYFGDFDPFGDFDLIFGAARLGLKLRDFPVKYRARVYGTTQISRFRHGLLLLQMYVFALFKFKWRGL